MEYQFLNGIINNMKKLILILSIILVALFANAQEGGSSSYNFKLINAAGTGLRIAVINPSGYTSALSNGINGQLLRTTGTALEWFDFPIASTTVSGSVKVDGTSITINNGIISAPNTGGGTVVAVTGTPPIVSSGGNSPAISITAATQSSAGSMSAADKTKVDKLWNLGKQTLTGTTPTWNVANGLVADITLSGNTTITLTGLETGMPGTLFVTNASTAYYIKFAGITADIKGPNLTINSSGVLCSGNSASDSFGWTWDGSILKMHVAKEYIRITW